MNISPGLLRDDKTPHNLAKVIHEHSLELLKQQGMDISSTSVCAILKSAGVEVIPSDGICRFPREVVEKCLLMAPSQFTLYGRDEEHDLRLGEGNTYITNDGTGNSILEYNSSLRTSTKEDLRNATVLSEALTSISVSGPMVTVSDSERSNNLVEIAECFKLSSKHIQHEVSTPKEAEGLLELIDLFSQHSNSRLHSQLSAVYCPVSPLRHLAPILEAYVLLAKSRIPIMIMPMPMLAATAPASIYATAVQANAEFLGTLCILQIVSPGLPIIYGAGAGIMAYKDASFSCSGPDSLLLYSLLVSIAKEYKLPVCVPGFVTDATNPGFRSQTEKIMTGFWAISSGVDLVYGIGMLGSSKILSLEQLVVDDDTTRRLMWFINRQKTQIVDDSYSAHFKKSNSTDILPYISSRSDVERFWKETYFEHSVLVDISSKQQDVHQKAHEYVQEILSNYPIIRISTQLCNKADKIIKVFSK